MKINNHLKDFGKIERVINKHLYTICSIVTIVAMAMILTEFFTRGLFPPARIHMFYLGVLVIYSFHKELTRWLGRKEVERQGEYFVYSWIILTTLLYVINFSTKGYFNYSVQGEPLTILKELSVLTLEVLAVFILTRGLKILKVISTRRRP